MGVIRVIDVRVTRVMGVIDENTQGLQELLNIQGLHGGR